MAEAGAESLRRLGGGRWETKDGRFRVEPQSGTWMVVDAEQVDDLGLPLVRGPFGSLGAAREAIELARGQGTAVSPLAEVVKAAKARPTDRPGKPARTTNAARAAAKPPSEPAWMDKLDEAQRRRARGLLRRLDDAGMARTQALELAREEIVAGRPALAQLAVERRVDSILGGGGDSASVARAIMRDIVDGEDEALGVGWRLVDREGRPIRRVTPPREGT